MKRIMLFVLSLVLVFGLVGCSDESDNSSTLQDESTLLLTGVFLDSEVEGIDFWRFL